MQFCLKKLMETGDFRLLLVPLKLRLSHWRLKELNRLDHLTHDLLKQITDNLGATIIEVVIDDLRENTFYAKIIFEVSALTNEIDARPSDAIALAVRAQAPIYVAESVMEVAAFVPSEEGETEEEDEKEEKDEKVPHTKEAKLAVLQNKLREAIDAEEYERAAKIRDDIQRLTSNN